MTHRRLLLVSLASIPLLLLVLVSLVCDVAARDLSQLRYCVVANTSPNRVLIRNCIAVGRCQNQMGQLRASLDRSHVIIKWSLEDAPPDVIPAALAELCAQLLTNREAKVLMGTPEWSSL